MVLSEEDAFAAPDSFREYRKAVSPYGGEKRQGKKSPHVRFANADTDKKLIDFVRRFGPVVISSLRADEVSSPRTEDILGLGPVTFPHTRTVLVARQDLAELRAERKAYYGVVSLVSDLQRGKQCDISRIGEYVSGIVENVSNWPAQWERKKAFRATGQGSLGQPAWFFSHENLEHVKHYAWSTTRKKANAPIREALAGEPIRAAHNLVWELVNAFAPRVFLWGNIPMESPEIDLAGGIRPVLYYILRREYLRKTRSIGICANTDCRQFFEIERFGQEFCGAECSRRQRQRDYFHRRGKYLRRRRIKKS